MKKFITNILYFGIILLIINMIFYAITYKAYFKEYEKINLEFDSYLFADSHGTPLNKLTEEFGIYNFSAASDSYFDILRKVKFLIKNTQVKRMYVAVDDHSLSPYRENTNNLERSTIYIIKEDYTSAFTGVINRLKKYMVLFNPGIREIIRSYVQSKLVSQTKKEEWSKLSIEKQIHKSNQRFNFQFDFDHSSISLTSSLEEIILLCNKNNIELIGIQFPLTKIYFNTIRNNSFNADQIFKKHNLQVYDFRKLYENNDEYFSNQDHLNQLGSIDFIVKFSNQLKLY